MKILFCGDIMAKSGREAALEHIPVLRQKLKLDFVIVNGENAAHGYGITEKITQELYGCGVDAITSGNHIWDQEGTANLISKDPKLLRPLNFPKGTPGKGCLVLENARGKKLLVANVMGQLFMDALDNAFQAMEELFETYRLGQNVDAVLVDMHAETTSEKVAMGHFLDGRATLVVGTHTHIPTADHQILPKGTAYMTDAGMTGAYNSIIGMDPPEIIHRFHKKMRSGRTGPGSGPGTLCGVYVESDDRTGKATLIKPIRLGGILEQTPL